MKPFGPPPNSIRSPSFLPRGDILSDRKILHYMARGFYGEARRLQAVAELEALKTSKKPKPKKPRVGGVAAATDYLNSIL